MRNYLQDFSTRIIKGEILFDPVLRIGFLKIRYRRYIRAALFDEARIKANSYSDAWNYKATPLRSSFSG